MYPQDRQFNAELDSKTYPLGENHERRRNGAAGALVTLSHTPLERQLYDAMLSANRGNGGHQSFTVRRLMEITAINSLSTIRRGMQGLVAKLSAERHAPGNGSGARDHSIAYCVVAPEEVLARRRQRGLPSGAKEVSPSVGNRSFERVIRRVVEQKDLSRREAQVALCCVEGLTNAEIGSRLLVTEQTVKFHLRNIFVKFGVRRRAELISRLLM
jgi:DNA-binding CsgD family transcriptional regulator